MLELKNICFDVKQNNNIKHIVNNVSLRVPDKSLIAITGPNGSGKSTLAKIIMGIEKPTKGTILFNNEDITDLSITERAHKGIAYAFQQPVHFKGMTVEKLLNLSAKKKLDFKEARFYLSEVGLCAADYINRKVDNSLSGGELKRIEIAGVLARQAKLTLFDEPEAGIDLWSFNSLIDVFKNIKNVTNSSIIIISHQERILEIADEILILYEGEIDTTGKLYPYCPKRMVCHND